MTAIETIKHLFIDAGALWVLWLLGVLSLMSVAITFERWFFYRTCGNAVSTLAKQLDKHLSLGNIEAALHDFSHNSSVAAGVAAAGLRLAHLGPASAEKAMQSAVALQRARLERGLAYLGTLGNNAPFIGLFGTVIGVLKAFDELGHGIGGATTQTSSQVMMTSISEALVTTARGIAVALPAVAAFNYFQRRVAELLGETEALSNLLLAYLSAEESNTGKGP